MVSPGRYYFERVEPSGLNSLEYPISRSGLWFQITAQGVNYIGDWVIETNSERVVKKLEIKYSMKSLDEIVSLCKIQNRKLFLDRTKSLGSEIVN